MANGPTMPPQAYTREVLTVAFQWLQNQPESIKKMAQTPDSLVGLYLRAQRYGHTAPENDAPVSSQNFISDLKNLSDGFKQFDETRHASTSLPKPAVKAPTPSPLQTALEQVIAASAQNHAKQQTAAPLQQPLTPHATFATQALPTASTAPLTRPPIQPLVSPPAPVAAPTLAPPPEPTPQPGTAVAATPPFTPIESTSPPALNGTSQTMIREVKEGLNLASDQEVLNMMVSIAYKKLKDLLA